MDIDSFEKKHNIDRYQKLTDEDIDEINNIINGVIKPIYYKSILYNYCGIYHECEKGNYEEARKYYVLANDTVSLNNLGFLCERQNNIEDAIKYYLLASEKSSSCAMNNLGHLYARQHNTKDAITYFLMAFKNGNVHAKTNLIEMYHRTGKNELYFYNSLIELTQCTISTIISDKMEEFEKKIKLYFA